MRKIVLASGSPRRQQLMAELGLSFAVVPSDVAESRDNDKDPGRLVERLALTKARSVAQRFVWDDKTLVIGADTTVIADGRFLGKPRDESDAAVMLRLLSGRWHQVFTGVAVCEMPAAKCLVGHAVTAVKFRSLKSREIDAYVKTGEPFDKAGAYAIQGKGALLVERIDGCFFNVVGLPLGQLAGLLSFFGVDILA